MTYTALTSCSLIVNGVYRYFDIGDILDGEVTDVEIAIAMGLIAEVNPS